MGNSIKWVNLAKVDAVSRLKTFDKIAEDALMDTMEFILTSAAYRSEQNAPILSGDLRVSITHKGPKKSRGVVSGTVGSPSPYALKMHEDYYKLGPVSITQPMTVEGGVGRKYVQRVVDYWIRHWKSLIRATIEESMEKAAMKHAGTTAPTEKLIKIQGKVAAIVKKAK